MTAITIRDASDLPLEDRPYCAYRTISSPKHLVHGWVGTTWVREDGEDWPDGAYMVMVNASGGKEVTKLATWGDTHIKAKP